MRYEMFVVCSVRSGKKTWHRFSLGYVESLVYSTKYPDMRTTLYMQVSMNDHKRPKISVVIPTHNRVDLLSRAIRSVLNQVEQGFEIIVVDDASTTDPAGVIDEFKDSRIRLIRHAQSKGGGAARNTGICNAIGDYVAFLDDDDEWLKTKLETQLRMFARYPDVGMSYTGFFIVDQSTGLTNQIVRPKPLIRLRNHLLKQNVVGTTSTVMVKKACLGGSVMFDENLGSCQDWDFYLKIVKVCSVQCVSEPLVFHYFHENRITRNSAAVIHGHTTVFSRIANETNVSQAVVSYHHFKLGRLYLQFGDSKSARRELLESISLFPLRVETYGYLAASFLTASMYLGLSVVRQKTISIFIHCYNNFKLK
jgi:glycosyltransferase involved in cell wall biosynthesis